MKLSPKKWFLLGIAISAIVLFTLFNPFSWNEAGHRTVVTQADGHQFVQYTAGMFYAGFFSKQTEWPNQISVSYKDSVEDLDLEDNTIEIGRPTIRFNDATTAEVSGIVQYVLPQLEEEMIAMHNAHKTPEALVKRRLAPYTKECLQSSAQLMSSEMHYGGGRAQMAQDYLDQLQNGAFLLKTSEITVYDSLEKTHKRVYQNDFITDKNKTPKRKFSSIKEYGITVADAQITDVDYETKVDQMVSKKVEASTQASVAKQKLMTAQQQALTAEAEGKKALVDIEYKEKQAQTQQVVQAETQVLLAEQDKKKQEIALQAARLEAAKIKELADAEAYAKAKIMQADGALEKKLEAYKEVMGYWADAFAKHPNSVVPQIQWGGQGAGGNAAVDMMQLMNLRALQDLNLNLGNKK